MSEMKKTYLSLSERDDVLAAYNFWARNYDADKNKTRDLDLKVVEEHRDIFNDKKVLELGCGTGKNTVNISAWAESVTAVDFSQAMLEVAESKLSGRTNVKFIQSDFTSESFLLEDKHDVCTINLTLEHIENLKKVFEFCAGNLISGGRLFISELHPFRQYLGVKGTFERNGEKLKIKSFIHNISDYLSGAESAGFRLTELRERFHEEDVNNVPRLITFLYDKSAKR